MADRVILVVRAGQTMRDAAVAAIKRLAEDGTHVSGIILNDWNPKVAGNGYHKYYGQYGAYQPAKQEGKRSLLAKQCLLHR